MELVFPLAGLDESMGFQKQPPWSTPSCLNVRAYGGDLRRRGGSRPGTGLALAQIDSLGSPILGLYQSNFVPDQSSPGVEGTPYRQFHESFDALSLSAEWANPPHQGEPPAPAPLPLKVGFEKCAYSKAGENRGGARVFSDHDGEKLYVVEIFIVAYRGQHNATYSLYAGLDPGAPNALTTGIIVDCTISPGHTYAGQFRAYSGGALQAQQSFAGSFTFPVSGWLRLEVNKSGPIKYRGTLYNQQLFATGGNFGAATIGPAHGFKIDVPPSGSYGLVDSFRIQYYPLHATAQRSDRETQVRSIMVAVAGGTLYRDRRLAGTLEAIGSSYTSLPMASDRVLDIADHNQIVYIADNGNVKASGVDGVTSSSYLTSASYPVWSNYGLDKDTDLVELSTGITTRIEEIGTPAFPDRLQLAEPLGSHSNVTFRILRGPKIYDPNTSSGEENMDHWTATIGQTPTGCQLLCRYSGRMVLAGYPSHAWYMSRVNDPYDWDYSATDAEAAQAFTSGEFGQIGDPITALIPHTDDYLVIACKKSLWVMRGDPGAGGRIDNISHDIGIAIRNGWCRGPDGTIYFISDDGLYAIPPGASGRPEPVSRQRLPDELRKLNEPNLTCCMVYDPEDFGIAIHLASSSAVRRHWFYDLNGGGFWPMTLPAAKTPRVAVRHAGASALDSGAIYGCEDGWVRKYSRRFASDEGTAIDAHVMIGPLMLGDDTNDGVLTTLDAKLGSRSGDIAWSVMPGNTAQEAIEATVAQASGTWKAGHNYRENPEVGGNAVIVKLASPNGSYVPWQVESISATARVLGRQVKP